MYCTHVCVSAYLPGQNNLRTNEVVFKRMCTSYAAGCGAPLNKRTPSTQREATTRQAAFCPLRSSARTKQKGPTWHQPGGGYVGMSAATELEKTLLLLPTRTIGRKTRCKFGGGIRCYILVRQKHNVDRPFHTGIRYDENILDIGPCVLKKISFLFLSICFFALFATPNEEMEATAHEK